MDIPTIAGGATLATARRLAAELAITDARYAAMLLYAFCHANSAKEAFGIGVQLRAEHTVALRRMEAAA